jgi:hypothetical protein
MMALVQSLPSHLWISALASFGIEQGNVRCRLQKTHQEDQLRLTDQSVCECLSTMNLVAPLEFEFGVSHLVAVGIKFAALWSPSHALPLDFPHTTYKREMIDLPVGPKPGWELDQEGDLPLKTVPERSVSFDLALLTCPWLNHWPAFSSFIH